jgi:hypothetical protein
MTETLYIDLYELDQKVKVVIEDNRYCFYIYDKFILEYNKGKLVFNDDVKTQNTILLALFDLIDALEVEYGS